MSSEGWHLKNKVGIMRQEKAWLIPCEDLDRTVSARLNELTRFDQDLMQRLRDQWTSRQSSNVDEITLLEEQIAKIDAQIRRLDKLLTDPAAPLSSESERRYLEMLRDAERDRQRLGQKLMQQEAQADPVQLLPNFYRILANFSTEFNALAPIDQKRLIRQVVQDITLNRLTPHLFQLHIVWQNGIAICPDVALIWRGMAPKSERPWSEIEDTTMRDLYPRAEQAEIMRTLPDRTWSVSTSGHRI